MVLHIEFEIGLNNRMVDIKVIFAIWIEFVLCLYKIEVDEEHQDDYDYCYYYYYC